MVCRRCRCEDVELERSETEPEVERRRDGKCEFSGSGRLNGSYNSH